MLRRSVFPLHIGAVLRRTLCMETEDVHTGREEKGRLSAADVYAEAWRGAYRGIIPHLSLERMIARRGEAWWKRALADRRPLLVLDFDGAASGYATYGRCRAGRRRTRARSSSSISIPSIKASALARSYSSARASGCSIFA